MKCFTFCLWLLKIATLVLSYDLIPGHVTPSQEIYVGNSINITCSINPTALPNSNAKDLYFYNTTGTEVLVPATDIAIINDTAIVYMLRNASAQNSVFSCQCKIGDLFFGIQTTTIRVGWAPQPVRDFHCTSYDFQYMICTFTRPYNPAQVLYNMTLSKNSDSYVHYPECSFAEPDPVICNITGPSYNNNKIFKFTLYGNNMLDSLVQRFNINNHDVMIPAVHGKDLQVNALTNNATVISWIMPTLESYKGAFKNLEWDLQIIAQNNSILKSCDYDKCNNETSIKWALHLLLPKVKDLHTPTRLELIIMNLPYAFYNYTLMLRVKLLNSHNWSTPFEHKFQTKPSRPDRPPRTNVGSFYIDSTETTVRLYWEELEKFEHNGDNFTYTISEVSQDGQTKKKLKLLKMESSSAQFEWDRNTEYIFEIRSKNNVNSSLTASYIRVPAMPDLAKVKKSTPIFIHNVYHTTNSSHTLSWWMDPVDAYNSSRFQDNDALISYTVYWCQSKLALQTECNGSIHFVELPVTQHRYTTASTQDSTLNFAVSANYKNFNTGMHWKTCSSPFNQELIKMEPETFVNSATAIEVKWSTGSVCPSILLGYNLTYCELPRINLTMVNMPDRNNLDMFSCMNNTAQNITITDPNAKSFRIEHLKAFSIYRIQMKMISNIGGSILSDSIYARTSEAAPSAPRQLQVLQVSNTSVTISWLPPEFSNGNIKYYIVYVNSDKRQYVTTADMKNAELHGTKIELQLDNLMSYNKYKIYLKAYTVDESLPSNDKDITTDIGYPEMPVNINFSTISKDENNETNFINIKWQKPNVANGLLDFYEVAVTQFRNSDIVRRRISIINGTECKVRIPTCINKEYKTIVSVRAVNVRNITENERTNFDDNNSKDYSGHDEIRCLVSSEIDQSALQKFATDAAHYRYYRSDWKDMPFHCSAVSYEIIVAALFVVVSGLAVMMGVYLTRQKCHKMASITVKFPPGLDSNACGYNNNAPGTVDIVTVAINPDVHSFHNEKHHLLSSISHDSGYLDEAAAVAAEGARCIDDGRGMVLQPQNHRQMPGNYLRSHSQSSSDSLVDSNASTAEPELCETDLQFNTSPSNYIRADNLNNCWSQHYAKPKQQQQQQQQQGTEKELEEKEEEEHDQENNDDAKEFNAMNLNNCSNYVAVASINTPTTYLGSGKPILGARNLCDYTTLEQVTCMSGYVTPGELNAFGQKQQQQGEQQQQQQKQCLFK